MLGRQLQGDDVLGDEEDELIRVAAWEHGARAIIEAVKICDSEEVRDPATQFLKVRCFLCLPSCSPFPRLPAVNDRASCRVLVYAVVNAF